MEGVAPGRTRDNRIISIHRILGLLRNARKYGSGIRERGSARPGAARVCDDDETKLMATHNQ
jgi:hypothetical protein